MTKETQLYLTLSASWINYWKIITKEEAEIIRGIDPAGEFLVVEDDIELEALNGSLYQLPFGRISVVREDGHFRLWPRKEYDLVILRSRLYHARAEAYQAAAREREEAQKAEVRKLNVAKLAPTLAGLKKIPLEEAKTRLEGMNEAEFNKLVLLLLAFD